ncbi:MAG: EamA family transporter [Deltaproteobacteria bacterium]|nr:EamA family transporter [Deltaproteobacteria bacterium]
MSSAHFWSILALFTFGLWGFFPKLATNYISPSSALVYEAIAGCLVGLAAFVSLGFRPEVSGPGVLYAGLAGATGLLGGLFYLIAASKGKISVVVTVTALYPVITILLAALFLKEPITIKQAAGMLMAVGAIYLLSS